jgi:hypothetical protein
MKANAGGITSTDGSKVAKDRRRLRRQILKDGSSSQGLRFLPVKGVLRSSEQTSVHVGCVGGRG